MRGKDKFVRVSWKKSIKSSMKRSQDARKILAQRAFMLEVTAGLVSAT